MSAPYRIAGCIVTYRSPMDQLQAAVASFLRCDLSTKLSIVDNYSGGAYVQQLKKIDGITLIESGSNQGFGHGHNIGIDRAAPSDYYLVLNPDVVIHDGALEAMVAYMDAHPDIALLAPKVLYPDGSLQPLNKRLPSVFDLFARRFLPKRLRELNWVKHKMARYEMQDVGYDAIVDVPFVSGCCMLFRTQTLKMVGGFDTRYFMYLEDCDITRRINAYGRAVYYPHATITHHWARGSHKSLRLLRVMLHSVWVYFNNWGWKWL